jgi:hypothetical protein
MTARVCRLQLLLALASAVNLGSESRGTHAYFTVSDSRLPQCGVPGPRTYISPRNRVVQLYTPERGSDFIASYDSQGYGGGIRTRLHTGLVQLTDF